MTNRSPSVENNTFQKIEYTSCCGRLCGRIVKTLSSDRCLVICALAFVIFVCVGAGLACLSFGTMGLAGYLGAQGSLVTAIATNSGLSGIIITEIAGGSMTLMGLFLLVFSSVTGVPVSASATQEEENDFGEYKYTCADESQPINLEDLMGSNYDPTTCGTINVTYAGRGRTKTKETIGFWHDLSGNVHWVKVGNKTIVKKQVLRNATRSGVAYRRRRREMN